MFDPECNVRAISARRRVTGYPAPFVASMAAATSVTVMGAAALRALLFSSRYEAFLSEAQKARAGDMMMVPNLATPQHRVLKKRCRTADTLAGINP
jgi:hypothetical protein